MQPTKPVLITSAQRLRDLRRDSMNLLTQKQRSAAFHAFLGELATRLEDKKTVRRGELVDALSLTFTWASQCVPRDDKAGAILVRENVIRNTPPPAPSLDSILQKLKNVSGGIATEEDRKVFARTHVPLGIPIPLRQRLRIFFSALVGIHS